MARASQSQLGRTRFYNSKERDRVEQAFLTTGAWKGLPDGSKGVKTLRFRLSKILHNHILAELPNLLKDVDIGLRDCQRKLAALGESRATVDEQRQCLLRASQRFKALMEAAKSGSYRDTFFGTSADLESRPKRLRAVVTVILKEFATNMRLSGHALHLVDSVENQSQASTTNEQKLPRPAKRKWDDYYEHVEECMEWSSGKPLVGLYNPEIIGDLFRDQSHPWRRIAEKARDDILKAAHTTLSLILDHCADASTIAGIRFEIVNPGMEPIERALADKVEELLRPHIEGELETCDHYFTDNIQKKRREETRRNINERLQGFFGGDSKNNKPIDR
jgi:hypothetical protein